MKRMTEEELVAMEARYLAGGDASATPPAGGRWWEAASDREIAEHARKDVPALLIEVRELRRLQTRMKMVLIVEDDHHKLGYIEQIVKEAGLLPISRLTAVEGVWFLRQYFDVEFDRRMAPGDLVGVITDWNMPRRVGEQITKGAGDMVLREMRDHPLFPVIVFSGDSKPRDVPHDVTWYTSDMGEMLLAWAKAIVPRKDKA